MGRKTSVFARKRMVRDKILANSGISPQDVARRRQMAWLAAIHNCTTFDSEANPANQDIAKTILEEMKQGVQALVSGQAAPEDVSAHDAAAHVIHISQIRASEMGGSGSNDVLLALQEASASLVDIRARWRGHGQWSCAQGQAEHLNQALQIYEMILFASSPAQMQSAQAERARLLSQMQKSGQEVAMADLGGRDIQVPQGLDGPAQPKAPALS